MMDLRIAGFCSVAMVTILAVAPAQALSTKECSVKYQAAKEAGKLNGLSWNDFRKSECAAAAPAAAAEDQKPPKDKKPTTKIESASAGLSMHECSVKYQAAKADKTLGDMKWNDFRKAKCGSSASDDETVPAQDEAQYKTEPETPTIKAPGGVKFPKSIAAKYASEPQGKARMHTCLDQYYANKNDKALGGLKWIQKGGGFYSICNAKLKG